MTIGLGNPRRCGLAHHTRFFSLFFFDLCAEVFAEKRALRPCGPGGGLTHNLTHYRKRAESSGCETAPENCRNCGTDGDKSTEKALTDERSEATDQKAGGSNPSWRARKPSKSLDFEGFLFVLHVLRNLRFCLTHILTHTGNKVLPKSSTK